jgi:translation initiation factor 5B
MHKTKIMDKLRNTNVQENEIGGITQQIGATFIDYNNIIKRTNVKSSIPGLLMIDTPGHEAFCNLRKRCSKYTDIVVLVIDIFSGLEPQTIESINLLVETNTFFIIALNKVDRLYGWNSIQDSSIIDALETNKNLCIDEFNNKLNIIKCQLQENSINSELYWNNNSIEDTISICPISALTGEGISNLLSFFLVSFI